MRALRPSVDVADLKLPDHFPVDEVLKECDHVVAVECTSLVRREPGRERLKKATRGHHYSFNESGAGP
jgi:hypothetical protein